MKDTRENLLHRNQRMRSLNIALNLQKKNYVAAMADIEEMAAACQPDDQLIDAALNIRSKIGPLSLDGLKGGAPAISLCMIVKNEIGFLGACLHAVKKLVDEIIVIDTGSMDRTADVAAIFGARTFYYGWDENFSTARNFSIEKARGDWILILDADEVIAPADFKKLRYLISRRYDYPICFSIETRNYTNLANVLNWQANDNSYPQHEAGLGWFPSRKVRLFSRNNDIYFSYPVHERLEPSIRHAKMKIEHCPIPVHHYGHLNEVKNRQKAMHYFKLGYEKLDQLGDDLEAVRELAVQAGELEYWPQALELWQRLRELNPDYPETYINLAGAYWQTGRYENALEYAGKAIELAPDSKEARYNFALSLLLLDRIDEACEILHKLVIKHEGYLAAFFMLAAGYKILGNQSQSAALFDILEKSSASKAISLAIEDLAQRFHQSGFEHYASILTEHN
ncbi:MAG: glycosyltransferase [Desulfobacteraceae bacterium]|nr:glycosyltransferase [Desulfobacteraceae bacterium]